VLVCVDTEGLKRGQHDEQGRPTVVQGEREVNKQLVGDLHEVVLSASYTKHGSETYIAGLVVLLHNVVDVRNGRRHEKREDEGEDSVPHGPEVDVNSIEDGQERETPANAIDDHLFAGCEELVDDRAEQKEVDEGPDEERPRGRCDVGLLDVRVRG
jgi:hypothetical protein